MTRLRRAQGRTCFFDFEIILESPEKNMPVEETDNFYYCCCSLKLPNIPSSKAYTRLRAVRALGCFHLLVQVFYVRGDVTRGVKVRQDG